MNDSILTSIKQLLGIAEFNTDFDTDIIIHINSVLTILYQLGIGKNDSFEITGSEETWGDYLSEETKNYNAVKSYIYLKVKQLFDPSLSSAVKEANNNMIKELEWRLNIHSETNKKEE
jgi:hypothetical protein